MKPGEVTRMPFARLVANLIAWLIAGLIAVRLLFTTGRLNRKEVGERISALGRKAHRWADREEAKLEKS